MKPENFEDLYSLIGTNVYALTVEGNKSVFVTGKCIEVQATARKNARNMAQLPADEITTLYNIVLSVNGEEEQYPVDAIYTRKEDMMRNIP